MIKIFLLAITMIFFTACSTKSDIRLNMNEISLEKYEDTIYHQTAIGKNGNVKLYSKPSIYAIDNVEYSSLIRHIGGIFASQYHSAVMVSGTHKIVFHPHQHLEKKLTFDFQNSHEYILDYISWSSGYNRLKFQIWLYDITSKEVVWGEKPETIKYTF
jgi:hypothetical protein